jgi:hypothetical protein
VHSKSILCDLNKTTNVTVVYRTKKSLASKKLILNMDDLGIFLLIMSGNYWSKLANGNQSLVLITDNTFSDKQKSLVLVFEVSGLVN